ncbi:hypothetical protein [Undibacterium sp. CY21W]|uniref:hypothetical protein n=1 Tax=Undibacterium sp. CY21W TaxID=2762293 RepID=UPI00164A52D7|nr:hypothetical protein [Undibacterium sp. CY21W]MBC3929991.1 hypothetical protein [Undibacterium sp. CY21W]
MKKCPWGKIDAFQSISEFNRFVAWMNEQVIANDASETFVKQRYAGASTLDEKWFTHIDSGEVWRLVRPDPPFAGVFEPTR